MTTIAERAAKIDALIASLPPETAATLQQEVDNLRSDANTFMSQRDEVLRREARMEEEMEAAYAEVRAALNARCVAVMERDDARHTLRSLIDEVSRWSPATTMIERPVKRLHCDEYHAHTADCLVADPPETSK